MNCDDEIDDLKQEERAARKWRKNDALSNDDPDKIFPEDEDEENEEL